MCQLGVQKIESPLYFREDRGLFTIHNGHNASHTTVVFPDTQETVHLIPFISMETRTLKRQPLNLTKSLV